MDRETQCRHLLSVLEMGIPSADGNSFIFSHMVMAPLLEWLPAITYIRTFKQNDSGPVPFWVAGKSIVGVVQVECRAELARLPPHGEVKESRA